LESYPYPAKEG